MRRTHTHRTVALAGIILFASALPAHSLAENEEPGQSHSLGCAPIRFYQKYISDLRYGHCQFEPSCSQYAIDAIEESGFFKGAALAADRLVRCHRNARLYYSANSNGRFSDPAHERTHSGPRLQVPAWLLPPLLSGYTVMPDSADIPRARDAEGEERRLEIAAFADAISDEGDCFRAETEYRRFAFLMQDEEARWWAQMKIAQCHFLHDDWNTAASGYTEAAAVSLTAARRNLAWRMAAVSRFNAADYGGSLQDLDAYSPTVSVDSVQTDFMRGFCFLALGDWNKSSARFLKAAHGAHEPATRRTALFLAQRAEAGPDLPRKNATMAGLLSAVLPGSGQVYAGREYDGLRHFVFDGLLIYTVYWLFKEHNYTGGYLLAGFTLPFYAGNIVGATRSAEYFNDSKRLEHVSRWMDQAAIR